MNEEDSGKQLAQKIVPGNAQCSCIVLLQRDHQRSTEGCSTLQKENMIKILCLKPLAQKVVSANAQCSCIVLLQCDHYWSSKY